MTHNSSSSKGKLGLILMAFVVLALMSMACDDVTPGDGQVREEIIDANSAIKDTATEVKEIVESTGEGLEVEEKGTVLLDSLWDAAKEIAEGE